MPCLRPGAPCDAEAMAQPGIIAEWSGVLADTHGQALPGVLAAVERLTRRGVAVVAIAHHDAVTGSLPGIHGPLSPAPEQRERLALPRPGLVLLAARQFGLDLPSTWLIGTSTAHAHAAAQAGCAGCVLIGATPPDEDLGIVIAQAVDFADCPRVMIPRGGGCWHDR